MIYYQIILDDGTPKRVVNTRAINKQEAAKMIGVSVTNISIMERLTYEDIIKKPIVIDGKLTYIENVYKKNTKITRFFNKLKKKR